jgi:hypothetical protein
MLKGGTEDPAQGWDQRDSDPAWSRPAQEIKLPLLTTPQLSSDFNSGGLLLPSSVARRAQRRTHFKVLELTQSPHFNSGGLLLHPTAIKVLASPHFFPQQPRVKVYQEERRPGCAHGRGVSRWPGAGEAHSRPLHLAQRPATPVGPLDSRSGP